MNCGSRTDILRDGDNLLVVWTPLDTFMATIANTTSTTSTTNRVESAPLQLQAKNVAGNAASMVQNLFHGAKKQEPEVEEVIELQRTRDVSVPPTTSKQIPAPAASVVEAVVHNLAAAVLPPAISKTVGDTVITQLNEAMNGGGAQGQGPGGNTHDSSSPTNPKAIGELVASQLYNVLEGAARAHHAPVPAHSPTPPPPKTMAENLVNQFQGAIGIHPQPPPPPPTVAETLMNQMHDVMGGGKSHQNPSSMISNAIGNAVVSQLVGGGGGGGHSPMSAITKTIGESLIHQMQDSIIGGEEHHEPKSRAGKAAALFESIGNKIEAVIDALPAGHSHPEKDSQVNENSNEPAIRHRGIVGGFTVDPNALELSFGEPGENMNNFEHQLLSDAAKEKKKDTISKSDSNSSLQSKTTKKADGGSKLANERQQSDSEESLNDFERQLLKEGKEAKKALKEKERSDSNSSLQKKTAKKIEKGSKLANERQRALPAPSSSSASVPPKEPVSAPDRSDSEESLNDFEKQLLKEGKEAKKLLKEKERSDSNSSLQKKPAKKNEGGSKLTSEKQRALPAPSTAPVPAQTPNRSDSEESLNDFEKQLLKEAKEAKKIEALKAKERTNSNSSLQSKTKKGSASSSNHTTSPKLSTKVSKLSKDSHSPSKSSSSKIKKLPAPGAIQSPKSSSSGTSHQPKPPNAKSSTSSSKSPTKALPAPPPKKKNKDDDEESVGSLNSFERDLLGEKDAKTSTPKPVKEDTTKSRTTSATKPDASDTDSPKSSKTSSKIAKPSTLSSSKPKSSSHSREPSKGKEKKSDDKESVGSLNSFERDLLDDDSGEEENGAKVKTKQQEKESNEKPKLSKSESGRENERPSRVSETSLRNVRSSGTAPPPAAHRSSKNERNQSVIEAPDSPPTLKNRVQSMFSGHRSKSTSKRDKNGSSDSLSGKEEPKSKDTEHRSSRSKEEEKKLSPKPPSEAKPLPLDLNTDSDSADERKIRQSKQSSSKKKSDSDSDNPKSTKGTLFGKLSGAIKSLAQKNKENEEKGKSSPPDSPSHSRNTSAKPRPGSGKPGLGKLPKESSTHGRSSSNESDEKAKKKESMKVQSAESNRSRKNTNEPELPKKKGKDGKEKGTRQNSVESIDSYNSFEAELMRK
ncbi:hypothetical protein HDU79_003686 [Rhizoclosmatium sp. JEL0117]|nr:hypothetical protein HDU79_003686 [Rhizoclosmatium sp. JEL0117]